MTNLLVFATTLGVLAGAESISAADQDQDGARQFSHTVFFNLAEPSDANREKLIEACKKYLSKHKGTVYFSVGTLAAEMDREVNVRDFDVSLHVVFDDRAAHDAYQQHPRHKQFVEEHSGLWKQVRVFDSYLD
jgi:hypothetical protein